MQRTVIERSCGEVDAAVEAEEAITVGTDHSLVLGVSEYSEDSRS
jgi:hypothetical protein